MICALEAGRRGRRVVLLEHAERTGKKILISGGGRCNFTNIHTRTENFLSENPHFAKSALARFTPADIVAMVERHGIRYHEKTLGQLFCDRSALDIVSMLERECAEARVTLVTGTRILSVVRDGRFRVETPQTTFEADAVVVATGGLSIPKMGATSFGYNLAKQFGLRIIECRPALVPLVFNPEDRDQWCDLSGVSTEVVAKAGVQRRREELPRKDAGDASRPERPRDPPDIVVLATRPGNCTRSRAGHRSVETPIRSHGKTRHRRCNGSLACGPSSPFCRALANTLSPRKLDERLSQRHGTTTTRLEDHARRNRRLREGRGNCRWCRYRGTRRKDHAKPQGPWPLLHRRSSRRNGMAGWLQLSVGLGLRSQCRPSGLSLQHT